MSEIKFHFMSCKCFVDQNQTYELYAMVDHFGTLRGGHYTATIKPEEEESWYEFNDSTVTLVRKMIP